MMFLNTWTVAMVVVTIILTMFQPTSAGLGDFVSGLIGSALTTSSNCMFTRCSRSPKCPRNFDTITKTRFGCKSSKKKKYCCQPDCFFTGCTATLTCPQFHRRLDINRNGCTRSTNKVYCCRENKLPTCFKLTCPIKSEKQKSCPTDYSEVNRVRDACASGRGDKIECCKTSHNIGGTSGNEGVNPNLNNNVYRGLNPNLVYGNQSFNPNLGFNGNPGFSPNHVFNGNQGFNPGPAFNGNPGFNSSSGNQVGNPNPVGDQFGSPNPVGSQGVNPYPVGSPVVYPNTAANQGVNLTPGFNETLG
ncbi:uncharacterized protein LOC119076889 [Bradysia coprophila]|uniref:uncharacterized protein LOC119076889 n=1 Tax=Bradysia coprophila TaxID=38358 RepID=UPI00187DB93C|nr:uncharacterized protein LOC119076889 [Bradysia coprophila]